MVYLPRRVHVPISSILWPQSTNVGTAFYLYRDYFEAKVYTIWVHGPLGYLQLAEVGYIRKTTL